MSPPLDWLSRLLEMTPVRGHLDLRCAYGAPWRIAQAPAAPGEIPYHVVLSGSAVLDDPDGGPAKRLVAGDIVLFPRGEAHVLHDGGGAPPVPAHERRTLNLTVSENAGPGERLDMLCGRFVLAAAHERLLRDHLPQQLVVSAGEDGEGSPTGAQLSGLVSLLRMESTADRLGGHAMLGALSTAMFALALRLASEAKQAPRGLLALAGAPQLAPALAALFNEPGRAWSLPELARLSHMSRATLARRFQETLGRSASDLLAEIRMTMAAEALRTSNASTAAIGESVGYQSEAAFQRAFKQHMGVTPARWRRAARAPDAAAETGLSAPR